MIFCTSSYLTSEHKDKEIHKISILILLLLFSSIQRWILHS